MLAEIHPLATNLAKLLNAFWAAVDEIEATNSELVQLGVQRSIERPLDLLARHVGCRLSELPEVGSWSLLGYLENPLPPDRLLGRAKELISRGAK